MLNVQKEGKKKKSKVIGVSKSIVIFIIESPSYHFSSALLYSQMGTGQLLHPCTIT